MIGTINCFISFSPAAWFYQTLAPEKISPVGAVFDVVRALIEEEKMTAIVFASIQQEHMAQSPYKNHPLVCDRLRDKKASPPIFLNYLLRKELAEIILELLW